MAFPVIASASQGSGSGQSVTVTQPTGVTTGDLLICIFGSDGLPTISTASAGWAMPNMHNETQVSSALFWKVATGSDDLTIDYSATEITDYIVMRITGFTGAPEFSHAAAFSEAPDTPSLAPSWGAADTLWISAYVQDNGLRTNTAFPANYADNQLTQSDGTTSGLHIAMASRNLNAATEDPGPFATNLADDWSGYTIAVQGAGAGGTTQDLAASGGAEAGGSAAIEATGTADLAASGGAVAGGSATLQDASFNGNIRLAFSMNRERGGYYDNATALRYVVFNSDHTAIIATGSALTTDANGNAVIDVNGTAYALGDYVPVLVTEYNAVTTPPDRVVRTMFGFVPAAAQP